MFSPSHPLRYFVSYNSRKVIRHAQDILQENRFSNETQDALLSHAILKHFLPIYRNLPGVDNQLFENKKVNLKLAVSSLNNIVIKPGETFSFWNLIGNPNEQRGFLSGLVISKGSAAVGIGGGLCQLANMIYWLCLHSKLGVTEKHRHSFDIFPDSNRKIPFGTGATVVYNYKDLRVQNNTDQKYQLHFSLNDESLSGEIRSETSEIVRYEVVERNHEFTKQLDGYYRSNEVYRISKDLEDRVLSEELVCKNHCKCQYTPEDC